MCLDSRTSALLVGGLAGGIIGAPIAWGMDEARRARKEQERAMNNQAAQQKMLLAEYKEANKPTAEKMTGGMLSTRDKQRLLARSMGGTLLTDPMASMPTMGKKTLLGE